MKIFAIIVVIFLLAQVVDAREDTGLLGPDGFLFPMKIWVEKFKLNFVFDQNEKMEKMLDLADERLKEAESLRNNSEAFDRARDEYKSQLEDLQKLIEKNETNKTEKMRIDIIRKMEDHRNRTKDFRGLGNGDIIHENIIQATSTSGNSVIKVNVVNGNATVFTEGNDAIVTRDGGNVTVISVTNNSRQQVIIRSSSSDSSSGSSSSSSSSSSNSVEVYSSSSVSNGD